MPRTPLTLRQADTRLVQAEDARNRKGLRGCFEPDDRICSDMNYVEVYQLLHQYLPEKFGVEVSLAGTSDLDAVRVPMKPPAG